MGLLYYRLLSIPLSVLISTLCEQCLDFELDVVPLHPTTIRCYSTLLTLLRCRSTLSVLYTYDLYPLLPGSALSYPKYSSIPFRWLAV